MKDSRLIAAATALVLLAMKNPGAGEPMAAPTPAKEGAKQQR